MKRFMNKKVATIGLAAGLLLGAGGAAFAYFTNSGGTGTGTGLVGASSNWTVSPTSFTGGPLYPGSGSQTGTVTVTNASPGHQLLTTITATMAAPTNTGSISGDPACTASDFALTTSTGWVVAGDGQSATYAVGVNEAGTAPGPAGHATSSALTLTMVNRSDTTLGDNTGNQDNCQNATPNVTYTVS
jgi:hypothetical protein